VPAPSKLTVPDIKTNIATDFHSSFGCSTNNNDVDFIYVKTLIRLLSRRIASIPPVLQGEKPVSLPSLQGDNSSLKPGGFRTASVYEQSGRSASLH
jgi:hypothetical protein